MAILSRHEQKTANKITARADLTTARNVRQ